MSRALTGPQFICACCGGKFTAEPVRRDDKIFCSHICASHPFDREAK